MVAGTHKIAVVINGDTEDHHLENVERSLAFLETRGFETYVASTQEPTQAHDHYIDATPEKVAAMLAGLKSKMSKPDDPRTLNSRHPVTW